MSNGSSDHHFGLAVNLSIEAMKALLLMNGGAATAFIALSGKSQDSVDYSQAVLAFGFGVLFTVLAFTAGYFSQLSYANHRLHIETGEPDKAKRQFNRHNLFQRFAIAFVIMGLCASGRGMFVAWSITHIACESTTIG